MSPQSLCAGMAQSFKVQQTHWIRNLSRFKEEDYVRDETLVGADLFSEQRIYRHKSEDEDDQSEQLLKLSIPDREIIINILGDYANCEKKPRSVRWCVWLSETLPIDFNLPITDDPPCSIVQAFVIAVDGTPFVLTLYQNEELKEAVQIYANKTASTLKWSLLGYCHLDFILLPCILSREFNMRSLRQEIDVKLADCSRCYRGPQVLNEKSFDVIKNAATALVSATSVPALLDNPEADGKTLHLMEKPWRNVLSLIIEDMEKQDQGTIQVISGGTFETNLKVRAAVIEAVKRRYKTKMKPVAFWRRCKLSEMLGVRLPNHQLDNVESDKEVGGEYLIIAFVFVTGMIMAPFTNGISAIVALIITAGLGANTEIEHRTEMWTVSNKGFERAQCTLKYGIRTVWSYEAVSSNCKNMDRVNRCLQRNPGGALPRKH